MNLSSAPLMARNRSIFPFHFQDDLGGREAAGWMSSSAPGMCDCEACRWDTR